MRGYANPPWCLIGHVLKKITTQQAQVVLVAPVWKSQAWYPVSPGDVDGLPSPHSTTGGLVAEGTGSQRDGHNLSTSRLACLRESTVVTAFQQPPGGQSPHRHTTPYSEDGLAGVLKGIVILFQDL